MSPSLGYIRVFSYVSIFTRKALPLTGSPLKALTNAGGALSDFWVPRERGLATALYATGTYLGPVIGPLVGGLCAEDPKLGWRFNFWIMLILSAAILLFGYLAAPETVRGTVLVFKVGDPYTLVIFSMLQSFCNNEQES